MLSPDLGGNISARETSWKRYENGIVGVRVHENRQVPGPSSHVTHSDVWSSRVKGHSTEATTDSI